MTPNAMKIASKATTATFNAPKAIRLESGLLSETRAWYRTKVAAKTLKIAPMSAASMTPSPTAIPARAIRTQAARGDRLTTAARPR